MRKGISTLCFVLAFIVGAIELFYGFKAYFIIQIDGDVTRDGWGRIVYDAPWYLSFVNIEDWPGLKWHLFDLALFFICLGLIGLFVWAGNKTKV